MTISDIFSGYYRYAPGADFYMEIWSGEYEIR